MKKTLALLVLGAIIGVVIWLNIERMSGSGSVPFIAGKDILPPPSGSPIPTDPKRNPTRAAAAILEKVVVNIDTVGRPVSIPDWGFLGTRYVTPQGSGSGVIVRPDGFIVTNNHVVQGAQTIAVTLSNGEKVNGEIWGRDPNSDLAVVKIGRKNLPYARFGNSDDIRVGDSVIAVGNALGLGTTVTSGIISALERRVQGQNNKALEKAIQTDAAINRGNSGGALALLNGDVIGINTAIFSTTPGGGNIGIGFAIPAKTVRNVVSELIQHRKYERAAPPWVGVQYWPNSPEVTGELKARVGVEYPDTADGVIIRQVIPGSPAATAQLKTFDQIIKLNGKVLKGPTSFSDAVHEHNPGETITLEIWRPALAKRIDVKVKLMAAPTDMGQPEPQQEEQPRGFSFPF